MHAVAAGAGLGAGAGEGQRAGPWYGGGALSGGKRGRCGDPAERGRAGGDRRGVPEGRDGGGALRRGGDGGGESMRARRLGLGQPSSLVLDVATRNRCSLRRRAAYSAEHRVGLSRATHVEKNPGPGG